MRYVIAYDVAADKRRQKVAELLMGWGRRAQQSVFECELSADDLLQVRRRLEALLELPADRCHVYRLCAECVAVRRVYGDDLEPAWEQVMVL